MAKILTEQEFNAQIVYNYTDVIGEKVGGKVLLFSDEWFAAADNLIKPKAAIRDATRFTHAGAWYDGWETRRHNTAEADYVIFKLGVSSARLIGTEVDTAFFNGNHAPHISVEAIQKLDGDDLSSVQESEWESVIPKTECGPSQRHFFTRETLTEKNYTHARLRMYPDGGIARFRLYGAVIPIQPQAKDTVLDLASVNNGGVAIKVSDQHFGSADNLLLPGRGHDMSDGWETTRSRTPGHVDWVVIRLGASTNIKQVVVDTAHFRGNFPQKVNVKAISVTDETQIPSHDSSAWEVLVGDSKTGPDQEHTFDVDNSKAFSHVLLTMIPDGGIKRVRVLGTIAN
ncbi:allantoinase [Suhomyces tanzawaensis NRRL Y-17324]|uniref:allantoicase n=1 Tax=Suhomyces tanzawaensis NRRL Y-17324 TaxID=984487 RepID=A0A1E4SLV6_9ASCO|nr:allantoinase [Suhomyces tanzawaensis NRRL Y-17324]ODV80468.1 allantoinase [Suhomyces tanzawaensis NRRL Y-17324]